VSQDQQTTSSLSRRIGERSYGSTGEGSDRRIERSCFTPRRIALIAEPTGNLDWTNGEEARPQTV